MNDVDRKLFNIGLKQLKADEYQGAIETFLDLQGRYPDNPEIATRLRQARCLARFPFLRPFASLGDGWVCKSPVNLVGLAVIGLVVFIGVVALVYQVVTPDGPETPVPPFPGPTESPTTVAIVTTESPKLPTETSTAPPSPDTPTPITPKEAPTVGLSPTFKPTETPTQASDTPTPQPATDTPTPQLVTDTPTPTPTLTGKIAVPVFDTKAGAYNVYIARASDDWKPELFFENGSQPAFSPDGQQIILRSWRQAAQGGCGQRLVLFPSLETAANDARRMTHNLEDAHPSLSSGEIVFHSRRKGQPMLFALGTWPGAEKDRENQAELVPGENPDWFGENRIIYYAREPSSGLYVRNNVDGSIELVLEAEGPLTPAAAPDDDHVAVSLKRGGHWHVFVLSVSQGKNSLEQLTNESADDQLPVWSPDSQSIAFVSNREGSWAVWVMNADGTNQRKLFDLGGPIDGTVSIAPNMSFGWGEERISWAP